MWCNVMWCDAMWWNVYNAGYTPFLSIINAALSCSSSDGTENAFLSSHCTCDPSSEPVAQLAGVLTQLESSRWSIDEPTVTITVTRSAGQDQQGQTNCQELFGVFVALPIVLLVVVVMALVGVVVCCLRRSVMVVCHTIRIKHIHMIAHLQILHVFREHAMKRSPTLVQVDNTELYTHRYL